MWWDFVNSKSFHVWDFFLCMAHISALPVARTCNPSPGRVVLTGVPTFKKVGQNRLNSWQADF